MCIIESFIALFGGDKDVGDKCTESQNMLIFVCIYISCYHGKTWDITVGYPLYTTV